MYYVYILRNKNSNYLYIGYTNDLKRRIKEHRQDRWSNFSFLYCEVYIDEKDARNREMKLKNYGAGLGHLRNRLKYSFQKTG